MNEPIPLFGYIDPTRPRGMTPSGYTVTLLMNYHWRDAFDWTKGSYQVPE